MAAGWAAQALTEEVASADAEEVAEVMEVGGVAAAVEKVAVAAVAGRRVVAVAVVDSSALRTEAAGVKMVAQAEKERERASAEREAVGTSVRASCSGRRERREWLVSAFGCSTRQNNETNRRRLRTARVSLEYRLILTGAFVYKSSQVMSFMSTRKKVATLSRQ
jgi:Tfp pilus assembly major pilin PilA